MHMHIFYSSKKRVHFFVWISGDNLSNGKDAVSDVN